MEFGGWKSPDLVLLGTTKLCGHDLEVSKVIVEKWFDLIDWSGLRIVMKITKYKYDN